MGALIYEGLASTPEEAENLACSGKIDFAPCHEHATVGPMAGIVSASMPVFIVKNESFGNFAYCTLNEGLGKVLRYGAFSVEVIGRLKWMETVMYPILKSAIDCIGRVDLKKYLKPGVRHEDLSFLRKRDF